MADDESSKVLNKKAPKSVADESSKEQNKKIRESADDSPKKKSRTRKLADEPSKEQIKSRKSGDESPKTQCKSRISARAKLFSKSSSSLVLETQRTLQSDLEASKPTAIATASKMSSFIDFRQCVEDQKLESQVSGDVDFVDQINVNIQHAISNFGENNQDHYENPHEGLITQRASTSPLTKVISRRKTEGNMSKKQLKGLETAQGYIKIHGMPKVSNPRWLRNIQYFQPHKGPIWIIEFSISGNYMATAGKDGVLCIWKVDENIAPSQNTDTELEKIEVTTPRSTHSSVLEQEILNEQIFLHNYLGSEPLRRLEGHMHDIIGVSWSKNEFILSLSKDKTVRLWHPSTDKCLRKFDLEDFATTMNFHPYDENIFLLGFLDGTVCLYSILDKKSLTNAHTDDIITCSAISPNGKIALIGTYHGFCKFYELFPEGAGKWYFRHTTEIDVRLKKGNKKISRKVSGIEFMPASDEIAVSCNDSVVRIYRMDDKDLNCMYKGHSNTRSHFKAKFSPDEKLLISCSENKQVYLWQVVNTFTDNAKQMGVNMKKNCNKSGGNFSPFNGEVSAVSFGAWPRKKSLRRKLPYVIIAASYEGEVKVFHSINVS